MTRKPPKLQNQLTLQTKPIRKVKTRIRKMPKTKMRAQMMTLLLTFLMMMPLLEMRFADF